MAIKYVVIPEKRKTIAILEGCKWDAVNRIRKMTGDYINCYNPKYLMPNRFKVSTVCDPRDNYDVEEGKRIAKDKLMRNYYKSMDKKIEVFRNDLININSRVFKTPPELMNED